MGRIPDKARWRELAMQGLRAAACTAAMLTGYAAGIALLVWRCAPAAAIGAANQRIYSAVQRGIIGVEQVRPPSTEFEQFLIEQARGRFYPIHVSHTLWFRVDATVSMVVFIWILAFLALGFACHLPMWTAPRAVRVARRSTEGSVARAMWRDAMQHAALRAATPRSLARMALAGLAIVVLCDVAAFLSLLLTRSRFSHDGHFLLAEINGLLGAAMVAPFVGVWLAARRAITQDLKSRRPWCTRCGYSLRSDPSGTGRCPECGDIVVPSAKPSAFHRLAPVLTRFAAITVLIAMLFGSSTIEDLWNAWRHDQVTYSDLVRVKVGGVVRVQYPEGTIWLRLDRIRLIGYGSMSMRDMLLRVVTERPDPASSPGERKVIRKFITIKSSHQLIGHLSNGDPIEMWTYWEGHNLAVIALYPRCATSIQAVDPATAPPFHE